MAGRLIRVIAPKWRMADPQNNFSRGRRAAVATTEGQNNCVVVNTARPAANLRDSIRIFTDQKDAMVVTTLQETEDETQVNTELVVYTNGSCVNNGKANAKAGSGVWYGDNDPRNVMP